MKVRATLGGLVLVAGGLLYWMSRPVITFPVDVEVIAHRGDVNPVDGYPENTLEALLLADERNPGRVEFDVQRSADGTWWVIHDLTVDRTTDGTGAVADLTDEQLASLTVDGGVGYRNHEGLRLATLDQVVEAMSLPVWWELDLKETTDEAHRALAEWVVASGLSGVHVSPQTATGVQVVRAVDPAITTVVGSDLYDPDVTWVSVPVTGGLLPPDGLTVFFDPAEVDTGLSETEKLSTAIRHGADAWMTNNLPEALRLTR